MNVLASSNNTSLFHACLCSLLVVGLLAAGAWNVPVLPLKTLPL
jgi:hypothetical protein